MDWNNLTKRVSDAGKSIASSTERAMNEISSPAKTTTTATTNDSELASQLKAKTIAYESMAKKTKTLIEKYKALQGRLSEEKKLREAAERKASDDDGSSPSESALQSRIAQYEADHESYATKIEADLAELNARLMSAKEEARESAEEVRRAAEKASASEADFGKQVTTLQNELVKVREELVSARVEKQRTEEEAKRSVEEAVARAKADAGSDAALLKAHEAQTSALQATIDATSLELRESNTERAELERLRVVEAERVAQLERELEALKEETSVAAEERDSARSSRSAELAAASSQLARVEKERDELEAEKAAETTRLRDALDDANERARRAEAEAEGVVRERNDAVNEALERALEATKRADDATALYEGATKRAEEATAMYEEAETRRLAAVEDDNGLALELDAAKAETNRLAELAETRATELASTETKLAETRTELESTTERVRDLEAEAVHAEEKAREAAEVASTEEKSVLTSLKTELTQARNDVDVANAERDALSTELAQLTEELDDTKRKGKASLERARQFEVELRVLREETLPQLEERVVVETKSTMRDEMEREIKENARIEFEVLREHDEAENEREMNVMRDEFLSEIAELETAKDEAERALEDERERNGSALERAVEQRNQLLAKNAAEKKRLDEERESERVALETALEEEKARTEASKERLAELTKQLGLSKNALERFKVKKKKADESVLRAEEERKTLTKRIEELESEASALAAAAAASSASIAASSTSRELELEAAYAIEAESARTRLEESREAARTAAEAHSRASEEQKEAFKRELESASSKHEERLAAVAAEAADATARVASLETALSEAREALERAERERASESSKIESARESAKLRESETVETLRLEVSALRAEVERSIEEKRTWADKEKLYSGSIEQIKAEMARKASVARKLLEELSHDAKNEKKKVEAAETRAVAAESRLAEINAAAVVSTPPPTSAKPRDRRDDDASKAYLKNVLISYMASSSADKSGKLLPVVSTLLEFTPEEHAYVKSSIEESGSITGYLSSFVSGGSATTPMVKRSYTKTDETVQDATKLDFNKKEEI